MAKVTAKKQAAEARGFIAKWLIGAAKPNERKLALERAQKSAPKRPEPPAQAVNPYGEWEAP